MVFACSVIVSSGYLLFSIIAIIQLFRILLYGHKLLSFATYFLLLCLWWSIMRCAYFGFGYMLFAVNERNNLLLFYCPTVLEFATFSFLLVYYEKHIQKQENWRVTKHYIIFIYILSTMFLATINGISVLIYCYNGTCSKYNKIVNKIYYVSFGIFYMVLLLFYCIYVRRLWKYHNLYLYSPKARHSTHAAINIKQNNTETNGSEPHLFPQLSQLASSKHIDKYNVTLHGKSKALFSSKFVILMFIIFVTRCLYFFILSIGLFINVLNEHNDFNDIGITGLFCIIVWEWLPTFLIIFFFRSIPSTNLCCPLCNCCPNNDDKDLEKNDIKKFILYRNMKGSVSDTSQSILDTSQFYNQSPPAPIIQKLIYQQQQTHSLNSRTLTPITVSDNNNGDHAT